MASRGDLQEYLELRNADGLLPLYNLQFGDLQQYCYSEEEIRSYLDRFKAIANGDDGPRYEILEFPEREAIEKSLDHLRMLDYNSEVLFDYVGESGTDQTPFVINDGKDTHALASLLALPTMIREIGMKGRDIQRFKGLGEMNPEELWETTMDPARRVLKQVTLQDAIETERMFATLMGNDVSVRRDFIERLPYRLRKK